MPVLSQEFTVSKYLFEQYLGHLATNKCFERIGEKMILHDFPG